MARTIAKDHDQKRDHILKSAARVFAQDGFARASMSRLAEECGISKANIYHYYASKDALLFDILDSYLSALRDRLRALPLDGAAPEVKLRRVLDEIMIAYQGMDHEHQIQAEGLPLLPAEQQQILRGYQRDIVLLLSGILAELAPEVFAGDRGKLRAATMSVFGMLNWFYMWNHGADQAERQDYAGLVAAFTLNGVRGL